MIAQECADLGVVFDDQDGAFVVEGIGCAIGTGDMASAVCLRLRAARPAGVTVQPPVLQVKLRAVSAMRTI